MATYKAKVQETNADLDILFKEKYNLQVAKSVSSPSGNPSFNVVFRSTFLANNMSVAWTMTYGLNWATEIPTPGADVEFGGQWQQCNPGQSFDLNDRGQWVPNQKNPDADENSLNVGKNGYPSDVNILVGVKDPKTNSWTPVGDPFPRPTTPPSLTNLDRSGLARENCSRTAMESIRLARASRSGTREAIVLLP